MSDEKYKPQVPLNVGWLSENDLLIKAGAMAGFDFDLTTAGLGLQCSNKGVWARRAGQTSRFLLEWDDDMMFTVAQLLELGFAPGEFKYCEHCKRLQVDCDAEQADIAAHNDQGA